MIPSKPQFVGKKIRLEELLQDTFAGEWGTETGENLTPVLRTSNFREDGSFNYDAPAMRCIPEKKVAKKRMLRGDIILEKSGGTPKRPVGIMAFYDSDDLALCSNFNQVLRFDESKIQPRFAFYQLRWLKEHNAFERYTRKTTGLQNLQIKKFIEHDIWVPTEEVQSRIVALLDAISNNQTQLNQQIHRFDSLVKSRFVEMFGDPFDNEKKWPEYTLGSLLKIARGGSPRPIKKYITDDSEGINWIKIGDAVSGSRYIFGTSEKIKPSGVKKSRLVHSGDFLLSNSMSFGKPYILKTDGCIHDGWLVLQGVEQHFDSLFLYQLLASEGLLRKFSSLVRGGVVSNLNKDLVGSVSVMVPPITLQRKFADFVCQVDKSRFVAQQQIEKLQLLYDSLAQEYFGD